LGHEWGLDITKLAGFEVPRDIQTTPPIFTQVMLTDLSTSISLPLGAIWNLPKPSCVIALIP